MQLPATGKAVLRVQSDWEAWIIDMFSDLFGHDEAPAREEMRTCPPDSFPVVICWHATRARFGWFHFWFVYPSDFIACYSPVLLSEITK